MSEMIKIYQNAALLSLKVEVISAGGLCGTLNILSFANIALSEVRIEIPRYQEYITASQLEDITMEIDKLSTADNTKLTSSLTEKEKGIVDIACVVAVSNYVRLDKYIKEMIEKEILSHQDIACIMRQQMIYCGCPCAMNGFTILNKITQSTENKNGN